MNVSIKDYKSMSKAVGKAAETDFSVGYSTAIEQIISYIKGNERKKLHLLVAQSIEYDCRVQRLKYLSHLLLFIAMFLNGMGCAGIMTDIPKEDSMKFLTCSIVSAAIVLVSLAITINQSKSVTRKGSIILEIVLKEKLWDEVEDDLSDDCGDREEDVQHQDANVESV